MLGSKSTYFYQSKEVLEISKNNVSLILELKGYASNEINIYLKAFDYFIENPDQFDGATAVKDLQDLPKIDLDAILHDFHYLVYNVASNFNLKWKADWLFAKGQERKGKGQYSAFSRFIGLTLIGIVFVPYARLKRGKISPKQIQDFDFDYIELI